MVTLRYIILLANSFVCSGHRLRVKSLFESKACCKDTLRLRHGERAGDIEGARSEGQVRRIWRGILLESSGARSAFAMGHTGHPGLLLDSTSSMGAGYRRRCLMNGDATLVHDAASGRERRYLRHTFNFTTLPHILPLIRCRAMVHMAAPSHTSQKKDAFPAFELKDDKPKQLSQADVPKDVESKKHLFFDEVTISVRGGNGGNGVVCELPKKGKGAMLKRTSDGDFDLGPGGGHGGNVILEVDTSYADLLHLHGNKRQLLAAKRGGNSQGVREYKLMRKQSKTMKIVSQLDDDEADSQKRFRGEGKKTNIYDATDLVIPVPPGTFVRTKRGQVLGDLVKPGQRLLLARGGDGGPNLLNEDDYRPRQRKKEEKLEQEFQVTLKELKTMVIGNQGQERTIELMLRTVADVGFVGFPNAGKSTLLAALTRASPEIQPYPFTTLMPNLGVAESLDDAGLKQRAPVLADLPGLIDGAHRGRGLGRQFLRHLRRCRVMLYILDTTSDTTTYAGAINGTRVSFEAEEGEDRGSTDKSWPGAVEQYEALRRELQLYNAEFLSRPHIVALNKLDLPAEQGGQAAVDEARVRIAKAIASSAAAASNFTALPIAIVPLSAKRGKGIKILREAIDRAVSNAVGGTD